ncbi:MAG: M56 family metallopeptidase, partial [Planctomycetaceae bacterium]|nr:M56 family metallopeptidase [Planctomycetaceae bacterium]
LFVPRHLRYCVGYAVLLTMLILPAITCFLFDPIEVKILKRAGGEAQRSLRVAPAIDGDTRRLRSAPPPALLGANDYSDAQRQFLAGALEILYPKTEPVSVKPVLTFEKPAKPFHWTEALYWQGSLPVLASLWCLGVTVCSLRLLPEWFALRRLRKTAMILEDGLWVDRLRRLTPRKILLATSEQLDSPILIGLVKPMILVPMCVLSGMTPAQIDLILAHELMHIRRYDYLANLVQLFVETLLFYHPLVWWVSRQVRRDREYLCDDLVVASAETDRVLYAKTLLHLEQLRLNLSGENTMKRLLSTPAAAARPLMNRVQRILGIPATPTDCRTFSGATCAILLAVLIVTPLVFYCTKNGFTQGAAAQGAAPPPVPSGPMAPPPAPSEPVQEPMNPMNPPQVYYPNAKPNVDMSTVIRVYSLKEMLDGIDIRPEDQYAQGPSIHALVCNIMSEQLMNVFPNEKIRFYQLPGKPAIIIAASQRVHDTTATLFENLEEVCETLKKMEGGELRIEDKIPGPAVVEEYTLQIPVREVMEDGVVTRLLTETRQRRRPTMTPAHDPPQEAIPLNSVTTLLPGPSPSPLWIKIEVTETKLENINVGVKLENVTLRELAAGLNTTFGIYASINEPSLEDAGINIDGATVTVDTKDIPLWLALNRVLKPLGLIYTINEDGDLVITTPEGEKEMVLTRVYKVEGNPVMVVSALSNTALRGSASQMGVMMPDKLVLDAPYSVHKKVEKILASM